MELENSSGSYQGRPISRKNLSSAEFDLSKFHRKLVSLLGHQGLIFRIHFDQSLEGLVM